MGMVVRTNTMANNAFRQLGMNNSAVAKSLEKLSSGFRINRAGDDAAGLAISERMKAQIKGLEAASTNSQDGISLVQTGEGALNEVHDMLNRMVELATKAANGVYTETQRGNYESEVKQLKSEIDRIADSTNFNSLNLLDGSLAAPEIEATDGYIGSSAATFEIDFTGSTGITAGKAYDLAIDGGPKLRGNAVGGTTAADLAKSFDGLTYTTKDGDTYTIKADDDKIILTNTKEGPADHTVNTTVTIGKGTATKAPTGAPTSGTFTDGDNATPKGAKTVLDLSYANAANTIGGTVTIGGTTYTFIEKGKGSGANGAAEDNEIEIDTSAKGPAIAAAVAAKLNGADSPIDVANFDIKVDGGKITIEEKAATATGTTAAVQVSVQNIGGLVLQVGDTDRDFNKLVVNVDDIHIKNLGLEDVSVATQGSAGAAIDKINAAIDKISETRAGMGAIQNRLEHTINNLDTTAENLSAAHSRIRDTDMAKEMMNYTKMNVLTQSAQAMLAQANQQPQAILQLLQ